MHFNLGLAILFGAILWLKIIVKPELKSYFPPPIEAVHRKTGFDFPTAVFKQNYIINC